jgi:hypothetical protein
MERVRDILSKRRWFGLDYLLAAALGVLTPFCSCSSIPLFIGFVGAGIPLGVTFAFLISSPLVNETSLYLFPALFGLKVTLWYNLVGIGVAILGGLLIQRLGLEKYIRPEFRNLKPQGQSKLGKKIKPNFWAEGMAITRQVFPYVVLGVAIGAIIHGFVPADVAERYLAVKAWWTVPLAVLLGIPLYANSVSVVPVMQALVLKGVPLGTALAFMTAIVTLSLPQALILKKVMGWQLLALFFGITAVGIMAIGYIFNSI